MNFTEEDYKNALNLPHYELKYHKKMPMNQKAAQFLAFQALVGFDESIHDASIDLEEKKLLDDSEKELINQSLVFALSHPSTFVCINYFENYKTSSSGMYLSITGRIERFDKQTKKIHLDDESKISLDNVRSIVIKS